MNLRINKKYFKFHARRKKNTHDDKKQYLYYYKIISNEYLKYIYIYMKY